MKNKGADQLLDYHADHLPLVLTHAKCRFSHDDAHIWFSNKDVALDELWLPLFCMKYKKKVCNLNRLKFFVICKFVKIVFHMICIFCPRHRRLKQHIVFNYILGSSCTADLICQWENANTQN